MAGGEAGWNGVVEGLEQVGDAARSRSLHAKQDAAAMAGDDGKEFRCGAGTLSSLTSSTTNPTRLEMEGPVAGHDGHFHCF